MSTQAKGYKITWVKPDFIDFIAAKIDPMMSFTKVKARVKSIQKLPDSMVQVTLSPNKNFVGHIAGQYVFVSIEKDGVTHQRAYSIVNNPGSNEIVIAAKVQGLVSGYLATELQVGDVLEITQADGDFTFYEAPENTPLFFIAAGSGITPMLSLVSQALNETRQPVTLLYYSRDPAYAEEFEKIAQVQERFKLHIIKDSEEKPAFFTEQTLEEIGIDPAKVHTFLCGAPGLMKAVNTLWADRGLEDRLTQERFVAPVSDENAEAHTITFRQKQKSFEGRGNLLISAENAGLNPAFGCRMGVCNTCACQKVSGRVKNQLTGAISEAPNEQIKLCVSEALGPVVIDA